MKKTTNFVVFLLLCTNSHNNKIEMEDGREAGSKPRSKWKMGVKPEVSLKANIK